MDGLDLSAFDKIDQDVFNGSSMESDDEELDLPLPDCIGIDSAVQDEEEERLRLSNSGPPRKKTRTETERELEVNMLRPDSIRRQILEQSLNNGKNKLDCRASTSGTKAEADKTHVMNIVEKAGMQGIDKAKINEIIHEASKGSMFYKKQAQRQAEINSSIEKMLKKVKAATPLQVANAKVTCDNMLEDLSKQRVFNRIIVHFDLDMFFAAVEIRDNPSLKDKPVAVGGDAMVSTSNYIARKYGVRAAMPGFIAKKLCPNLVLIKPNGFKYRQTSSEVFSILEDYDPELSSMSLDEAYLDLTDYVKGTLERDKLDLVESYDGTLPRIWWARANEVVDEIRYKIFQKTQLTCSAGIACNTLLAKISTDINKPDGQYMVEGYPKEVKDFISNTPIEKVSGIGKVSTQFLKALDITNCGDIYEKRHFLPLVFYDINVRFYLRVSLGDGSTCVKSDEQRKSKSVERTFAAIRDPLALLDKLDSICEELCTRYLRPYRIRGRTVTVKLKRNTFTTTTKSYSMLVATNDKDVIYSAAKNLLLAEIANEPPEIKYRLLGVKISNLADDGVTTNQLTIDAMLRNQALATNPTKSENCVHRIEQPTKDDSAEISQLASHDTTQHVPQNEGSSPKREEYSTFHDTSPQMSATNSSTQSTDLKSPKSFYQRFIELNSQSFSQTVKVEPFQCPYCQHGFLKFEALEHHVTICSKKN